MTQALQNPTQPDLERLMLQLNDSMTSIHRRLDQLLEVQRQPVGFQPDKLKVHQIQIRRNRELSPDGCLQQWEPTTRKLTPCISNTLSLYLTDLRLQSASGGGKYWEELVITGYAGPRVGWVDLIATFGGLTCDALLSSLLGMVDEQLRLPVTLSFRPAPQSDTVVLVRVGDHRNDWMNPAPQRAQWGKDSRGMLVALQHNLRRSLHLAELRHEAYAKANQSRR